MNDAPSEPRRAPRPSAGALRFTDAADEAMRAAGLLIMALMGTVVVPPLLAQPALHPLGPRVGLAMLVCIHVACTMALVLRSWSRPLLWGLYVAVPASFALMAPARPGIHPSDLWATGVMALPLVALTMLTLPRRRHARWLLGLAVAVVVIELYTFFGLDWQPDRFNVIDSLFLLQTPLAYVFSSHGLIRIGEARDEAAEQARSARAAQRTQHAEADGRREAARLLHDHVLHALHALARPRHLVPTEQAVLESRVAVEQLFKPSDDGRTVNLREALEHDRLVLEVVTSIEGDTDPVPAPVAEPLLAAVHEALNNVRRHARASQCRLVLANHGPGCWVRVIDDGRGFDVRRNSHRSLGLRRSVVERLADIGGRATVSSSVGNGTTVDLRWPAAEREDEARRRNLANRQVTRIMSRSAMPTLAMHLVMGPLIVPLLEPVWLGLACWLVTIALGTWQLWRLQWDAMPRRHALLLVGVASVIMLTNLAMVPRDATQIYLPWAWWGAGGLIHLVMVSRDTRRGLQAGAVMLLVMVAGPLVHFGPAHAWQHYVNTMVMGAAPPIIAFGAAVVTRHIQQQATDEGRLRDSIQAATARLHEMSRVENYLSEQVKLETVPLLRGVAAGELDPSDEGVRAEAARLEVSIRDELVLGPDRQVLAATLQLLRADGWQLRSSLSQDDTADSLDAAERLLQVLGMPSAAGQMLTISANEHGATAVVFDADPEQMIRWKHAMSRTGGRMDIDPEFVRIVVGTR